MLLAKGEVWIIKGRKGRLVVKLLEDVDPSHDMFFEAELISGIPIYISGTAEPDPIGATMTFRTSITTFVRPRDD